MDTTDSIMPSLSAGPRYNRSAKLPSCQNCVPEMTIDQFLKYLEVLKEGETALREEVERDEAIPCEIQMSGVRRHSLKQPGVRRLSRCPDTDQQPLTGYRSTRLYDTNSDFERRKSLLSVNTALPPVPQNLYKNDTNGAVETFPTSSLLTRCGLKPFNLNTESRKSRNSCLSNGRACSKGESSNSSSASSANDVRDVSPQHKGSGHYRKYSSASTISVFLPVSAHRRISFEPEAENTQDSNNDSLVKNVIFPSITLSAEDPILSPRTNRFKIQNLVVRPLEKSERPAKKPPGAPYFSDYGIVRKQTEFVANSETSRQVEVSRKFYRSNTKDKVLIREVAFPCYRHCFICHEKGSPGPLRVFFCHTVTPNQNGYLDGIVDGSGKPAWPAHRRKEIKGLVYDRLSHSFHPPQLRRGQFQRQ